MPAFSALERRRPSGSVVVPPEAFADAWEDKPSSDVCIGLRFVSDADLEDARIEALRRAAELVPNHGESDAADEVFVLSFHDAMIRWIIARATCDPNDATRPWEGWATATEDKVFEYACHEGNYAMGNILRGARLAEREAMARAATPSSGARED